MILRKLWVFSGLLISTTSVLGQAPVDGGKVANPAVLSPYGQIGGPLPKVDSGEKKSLDLEAPALDQDKIPLGALPRCEVPAPYSRFFLSGEYIGWNLNNTSLNPVVFNVPAGVLSAPISIGDAVSSRTFTEFAALTPQSQAQLSQNGVIDYGIENGMRFIGGITLEPESGISIVGNAIVVPTSSYVLSSNTSFNMAPIVFQTGLNSQVGLGSSDTQNGGTQVTNVPVVVPRNVASEVFASANNFLGGGEIDLKGKDLYMGDISFSGILGFRYFQFNESLQVNSKYTIEEPPGIQNPNLNPDGTQRTESNLSNYYSLVSSSSDYIKVYNHFYGPQIGTNSTYKYNNFSVDCNGKLGIGVLHQVANIDSTTVQNYYLTRIHQFQNTPDRTDTSRSGLLYSPYDVGRHSRNQFGLLPELNVKLGYKIFDKLKITAGYDFVLLANVLRATNQSQLVPYTTQSSYSGMNVQQQSSSQSIQIPAFTYTNSTLIINGISFGAQLDF